MDKKTIIFSASIVFLVVIIPIFLFLLFSESNMDKGRIEVNELIDTPFLKNIKKDNIILFFGYVGCTVVCTPILNQLNTMYEKTEFRAYHSTADIVFVNLTHQIDPVQAQQFAQAFNHKFKGIYLNQRELMNIERTYRLFFSKNLFNKTELNHSDYIYLIERLKNGQFILKYIYNTHPFKPESLIDDLIQLTNKV